MREDICSIPVNDVFGPKDGCPICRMRDMLEDRITKYITGAAMMEPDVRIETNRLGFCSDHFNMIVSVGSRLSVALILESHLKEIETALMLEDSKTNVNKIYDYVSSMDRSCFVCENINKNIDHIMQSVIKMWEKDEEFRKLYSEQGYICLKHYGLVVKASEKMQRKARSDFLNVTKNLTGNYLKGLEEDTTHFCRMFDYRNNGEDFGNSKNAIERSIKYITSRDVQNEGKAGEKNR